MQQDTMRNPNAEINDIMQTIDALRSIYVRETEALEKADSNTFMSLQDEKLAQAGIYQNKIQNALKRKDAINKADPTLKQKLQDMQADFAQLAGKNISALERMQRCTERLSQKIRFAAKETAKKRNNFSYGESGTMNNKSKKPLSMGIIETA